MMNKDEQKKKVSIYNLGCKVNFADISQISSSFEEMGHTIVKFGEESDIVLINTCTVTNRADKDARKITRRALKNSPGAYIGVMGCYAQLKPEELAKIKGVDAVFGNREKFDITNLVQDFSKSNLVDILVSDLEDAPFHTSVSVDNESRTRVVLKLQDGCNYNCTYCTIPMARGASRSMAFDDILPEIEKIRANGKYEVVLSGINLGDYHDKQGHRFVDVARLIDENITGMRFRISSIEPNLLTDKILDIVAKSEVFVPHFHIPLQSGSPGVLRKMRRRYKASDYRKLILKIKDSIHHCCIGADVITGFPGETDENFAETYKFLEELPVSYLHAFTYSERDNTIAAEMGQVVPMHVRKYRTNRLRKLSNKKKTAFYDSQLGSIRITIPETYNPASGYWTGWTENYVRVHFPGPEGLEQNFTSIRLLELGDAHVNAELV